MPIQITGLISGYDTDVIMDAIVAAAAVPRNQVQSNIDELTSTQTTLTEMSSKLSAIADLAADLGSSDAFPQFGATLSSTSSFTATVDSNTVLAGAYDVEVTALAVNTTLVSNGFDDASASGVVAQGTLSITVGGSTTDLTVDGSNDSLTDLAAAIDEIDGVSAYVLDTGASVGRYKLVVLGDDTGTANAVSMDTSGLVTGGTVPTITEAQAASDATLTVNGISVSSSDNDVTIVPGLNISLTATGSTEVLVARDDAAITAKVQAFADAYNDLVTFYGVNSNFDTENGISGSLVGESGARRIMTGLQQLLTSQFVAGGFTSLAQVGFATNQDGTVTFDATAFGEVLDEDWDSVLSLFTAEGGPMDALETRIEDVYVDADAGIIGSRLDSIESTIERFEERIVRMDEHLEALTLRLETQFARMEETIAQLQGIGAMLTAMIPTASPSSSSESK